MQDSIENHDGLIKKLSKNLSGMDPEGTKTALSSLKTMMAERVKRAQIEDIEMRVTQGLLEVKSLL